MIYAFKIIRKRKTSNDLQKGKELPAGQGNTMQQDTLVTKYYAQIVGMSEEHC